MDEVNADVQKAKSRVAHGHTHVGEAKVILTPPRALGGPRYNVRRIAHVASVKSEPGAGFAPVNDLGQCVRNVITAVAHYNRRVYFSKSKLRHIVFPLLATGQALQSPEVVVPPLINAAIDTLNVLNPNALKEVYFLARTDTHFDLLERQLTGRSDKLEIG